MNPPRSQLRRLGRRAIGFALAIGLIALCGAWLLFGRGALPIQTDLLALLPATEQNPLADRAVEQLAHANGDRMVLLVEGRDDAEVKQAATALGQWLQQSGAFGTVLAKLPPFDLSSLVEPYLKHRFYLLGDEDRAALAAPDFRSDAALARHLNEPLLGGVGPALAQDPFGWLGHWLAQAPWSRSPLLPEDDLLTAHQGDATQVLVTAELKGSSYDDRVQARSLAALVQAEAQLHQRWPQLQLQRTGAVFYAASARAGAERDGHLVGAISTLGIAVLLLWAFRSPSALLLAFLSTAIGVLVALTVTIAVFGQIHLLTLVFGAALLGEAVDYSIQYLAARANSGEHWQPARGLRQVRMALWLALGTSLLGYALLGLVPFPALKQMSCFAMVGMTAACASVFFLLPALLRRPARPLAASLVALALAWQRRVATLPRPRWLLAGLLLVALPGWLLLNHQDDIHLLIDPPASLVQQEARIRQVTGLGDSNTFYLVSGESAEQVLQREEALRQRLDQAQQDGSLDSYTALTSMVPSLARQRADHALIARLFGHAGALRQALLKAGLREQAVDDYLFAWPGTPLLLKDWLRLPIATPFRYLWMGCGRQGCGALVLPQGPRDAQVLQDLARGLPGVALVDKPASVSQLFGRYRRYASVWLLAALLLIAPVFAWRYGLRAMPRVLAPPLFGLGLTLSLLGYLDQPLTLFHWMALMLVLGVGANYAVFLREGEPHAAHRPGAAYAGVLLSALTALLSFGLLALSTMPALAHFGLTLLLGIGLTVLAAPLALPPKESAA